MLNLPYKSISFLIISILICVNLSGTQLFGQAPIQLQEPTKDVFDHISFGVQIVTLIALGLYVYKTWHIASGTKNSVDISREILKEMRDTRDQEISPYLSAYFDFEQEGKNMPPSVFFNIKNDGKTPARNIKLDFDPPLPLLKSFHPSRNLNDLNMIRNGIPSMPPGFRIRTLFGFYPALREKCSYFKLKITYEGLKNKSDSVEYVLDLSLYEDLLFSNSEQLPELTEQIKKTQESIEKIGKKFEFFVNRMDSGLWVNNERLGNTNYTNEEWRNAVRHKLVEFNLFWETFFGTDFENLNDDRAVPQISDR